MRNLERVVRSGLGILGLFCFCCCLLGLFLVFEGFLIGVVVMIMLMIFCLYFFLGKKGRN